MKKFLIRLGLFSAIIFALVFVLGMEIEKKNYAADYMAAIADKHHRLDSIAGPRIIFVGGSSTSFGIDSKEVGDSLGIPATNLALVAGLGLDFMLNEIEAKMRQGDIVVLSSEFYLNVEGSYELKKYTARCFPEAENYFKRDYLKDLTSARFKQIKNNFDYLLHGSQQVADTSTDFGAAFIHRTDFNQYGDMVGHIGKRPPAKLFYKDDYYPYHYYKGIDRINKLADAAKEKNVKLLYIYHAMASSAYNLNKATIARYEQDMREDLKFPVLGKQEDFVYDDSLFFDTAYHLNPEARKLRTQKVIALLRQALKQ